MKKNILFLPIILLVIKSNLCNSNCGINNVATSSIDSAFKHEIIEEEYIKYFPYLKIWVENFNNIDISKIDIKKLPSPYNQLKTILPFNPKGWYFNSEYIKKLFDFNYFVSAIEVGSYFGASSRHIASLLPQGSVLYSVDPWDELYVIDNWSENMKHYEQFLSNIVISGLTHKIIPIRQNSNKAIEFFRQAPKKIDFIYIDGDHETAGVLSDLENYFFILSPTGVICGDDWLWKKVRAAVVQFAQKYDLTIYADCNFWFLKKEDCGYCYKSFFSADDSAWKFDSK